MAQRNILDVMAELQTRGLNDAQIVAQLKNLGYTGQEVSDAMNQFKAKAAVVEGEEEHKENNTGKMQPSIMQAGDTKYHETAEEGVPVPRPTPKKPKKTAKKGMYAPTEATAESSYPYAYQQQATQQLAPSYAEMASAPISPIAPAGGAGGAGGGVGDIETIEEIAEEIVAEKFSELKKKMSGLLDFKELVETKINGIDTRLKGIESSISRLQQSLLGRMQEYSRDIKNLGAGMQALENAFSKILNPLVDSVKELGSITSSLKKDTDNSKKKK